MATSLDIQFLPRSPVMVRLVQIRRCLFVALLTSAAALLVRDATQAQPAKGKKYALLVGVKTYKRTNKFPDLQFTENDVEKLAAVLREGGFAEVRLLTTTRGAKDANAAPTAANVRSVLGKLVTKLNPADTVLVALSGHGIELVVSDPDGKGKSRTYGYFCPSDADLVGASYGTGRSPSLILMEELFDTLGSCGAGAKLVLMDACRNEQKAEASTRGLDIDSIRIPRGVGALFSCKSGERAFETKTFGHGVFFHYVLKGLTGRGASQGKEVTWDRLNAFVKKQVVKEVPSLIGGGARQTPASVSHLEGDPVLLYLRRRKPISEPSKTKPANEPKAAVVVEQGEKGISNSIGMKFVRIPAGQFTMGSPAFEKGHTQAEQQRLVKISKEFRMGVHEVTQKQFKDVMGYNPSYFSIDGQGKKGLDYREDSLPAGGKAKVKGQETNEFPVENISWLEAEEFCKKLTARPAEKKSGRTYRLPTEAEWEYACRGGAATYQVFHFGDTIALSQANFSPSKNKEGCLERTCQVGSYKPNGFGLHDMHGNVREYCSDRHEKISFRLVRGGSWIDIGMHCRSAHRGKRLPGFRGSRMGFRVVLVPAAR